MRNEHEELRRGTLAAGERLPTIEQCAQQRTEYEHAERAELDGVRHIGGLIDIVMARIHFRVAMRKGRNRGEGKEEDGGHRRAG